MLNKSILQHLRLLWVRHFMCLMLSLTVSFSPDVFAQVAQQVQSSSTAISRLPENIGWIEKAIKGPKEQKIILIQDAHDSLEAQENIAKLIQFYVKTEDVRTVYEEGYEGPLPTDEYFSGIANPLIKKKLSYFFLDRLRLGGAEYAHINRVEDFDLVGVDDKRLHLDNIKAYEEASNVRVETEKDLLQLYEQFNDLAADRLSKEMKAWLKLKSKFDQRQIDLFSYIQRCVALMGRHYESEAFPVSEGILALGKTIQLNDDFIIPSAKSVMAEINNLEDNIANIYVKSRTEKLIFDYLQTLSLLLRLNRIEVSAEEYRFASDKLEKFKLSDMATFLAAELKKPVVLSSDWQNHVLKAINFYKLAHQRDLFVVENLQEELSEREENVSILVFGGFHKEPLMNELISAGYSVDLVNPYISGNSTRHQNYYKQIMGGQHHEFEVPLFVSKAAKPLDIIDLTDQYTPDTLAHVANNSGIDWDLDQSILNRILSKPGIWSYRSEMRAADNLIETAVQKRDGIIRRIGTPLTQANHIKSLSVSEVISEIDGFRATIDNDVVMNRFFDRSNLDRLELEKFDESNQRAEFDLGDNLTLTIISLVRIAERPHARTHLLKIKNNISQQEQLVGYMTYSLRPRYEDDVNPAVNIGFHIFSKFRGKKYGELPFSSRLVFEKSLQLIHHLFPDISSFEVLAQSQITDSYVRMSKYEGDVIQVGNAVQNAQFYLDNGFYPESDRSRADSVLNKRIRREAVNLLLYRQLAESSDFWILPLRSEQRNLTENDFIIGGIRDDAEWESDFEYERFTFLPVSGLKPERWFNDFRRFTEMQGVDLAHLKGGVGLSIGFGNNWNEIEIVKEGLSLFRMKGVDWNPMVVENAARYFLNRKSSPEEFQLYHANAKDLSGVINENSVDFVFGVGIWLSELNAEIAAEVDRVLKPGGIAYFNAAPESSAFISELEKHGRVVKSLAHIVYEKSVRAELRQLDEIEVKSLEMKLGQEFKDMLWAKFNNYETLKDGEGNRYSYYSAAVTYNLNKFGRLSYLRVADWIFMDHRLKERAEKVLEPFSDLLKSRVIYLDHMESSITNFDENLAPFAVAMAGAVSGLDVAGKTVLDMGAGSGLLSLMAYKAGANVVLLDFDEDERELFEKHVAANDLNIRDFDYIIGDINEPGPVLENLSGRQIDIVFANIGEHPIYPKGTHLNAIAYLEHLPTVRTYVLGGYGLGFEDEFSGEPEQDYAFEEAIQQLQNYGFHEFKRFEQELPGTHAADWGIKTAVITRRTELRSSEEILYLRGGRETVPAIEHEFLAVLDESGELTEEKKTREEIHRDGIWHETAHVYIFDEKGRVLLQKRSMAKRASPGKFQVSISGHVEYGLTSLETAHSEGNEELGVAEVLGKNLDLIFVDRIKRSYIAGSGDINNEFSDVYAARVNSADFDKFSQAYNVHEIDSLAIFQSVNHLKSHVREHPETFARSIIHAVESGLIDAVERAVTRSEQRVFLDGIVRQLFARAGVPYRDEHIETDAGVFRPSLSGYVEELTQFVQNKDLKRIIDLGSGQGTMVFAFAYSHENAEVLGIEYDERLYKESVKVSQALFPQKKERVSLKQGNFNDELFDADIFEADLINYWESGSATEGHLFNTLSKRMRSGAYLLITKNRGFLIKQLRESVYFDLDASREEQGIFLFRRNSTPFAPRNELRSENDEPESSPLDDYREHVRSEILFLNDQAKQHGFEKADQNDNLEAAYARHDMPYLLTNTDEQLDIIFYALAHPDYIVRRSASMSLIDLILEKGNLDGVLYKRIINELRLPRGNIEQYDENLIDSQTLEIGDEKYMLSKALNLKRMAIMAAIYVIERSYRNDLEVEERNNAAGFINYLEERVKGELVIISQKYPNRQDEIFKAVADLGDRAIGIDQPLYVMDLFSLKFLQGMSRIASGEEENRIIHHYIDYMIYSLFVAGDQRYRSAAQEFIAQIIERFVTLKVQSKFTMKRKWFRWRVLREIRKGIKRSELRIMEPESVKSNLMNAINANFSQREKINAEELSDRIDELGYALQEAIVRQLRNHKISARTVMDYLLTLSPGKITQAQRILNEAMVMIANTNPALYLLLEDELLARFGYNDPGTSVSNTNEEAITSKRNIRLFEGRVREVPYLLIAGGMDPDMRGAKALAIFPDYENDPETPILEPGHLFSALAFSVFYERTVNGVKTLVISEVQSDAYATIKSDPAMRAKYRDWRWVIRRAVEQYAVKHGYEQILSPISDTVKERWPALSSELALIVYDTKMKKNGYKRITLDEAVTWDKQMQVTDWWLKDIGRFVDAPRAELRLQKNESVDYLLNYPSKKGTLLLSVDSLKDLSAAMQEELIIAVAEQKNVKLILYGDSLNADERSAKFRNELTRLNNVISVSDNRNEAAAKWAIPGGVAVDLYLNEDSIKKDFTPGVRVQVMKHVRLKELGDILAAKLIATHSLEQLWWLYEDNGQVLMAEGYRAQLLAFTASQIVARSA